MIRYGLRFFGIFLLLSFSMCSTKQKRVIFFGDSITQMGVEPGGYIDVLNRMLEVQGKDNRFELIGSGISGNKVYDLYLRMEQDILAKNPDAVVIWIGVNDVWHKSMLHTGTDPDKFEKFYKALVNKLQEKNIRVILCTPAVIGEKFDRTNQQDDDLDLYAGIIRKVSREKNCQLCDLREVFQEYETKNNKSNMPAGILTYDGVHLNAAGNKLVAETLYPLLIK